VTTTVLAAADRRSQRHGRLAVLLAALAWSSAGVVQRELTVDAATQVAGRALFAALVLLAFVAAVERGNTLHAFRSIGRSGWVLAVFMAFSSGTFMLALNHTSVANVLFMFAIAPLAAAALARVFLGEQVSPRTWAAMGLALAGVVLMVGAPSDSDATGRVLPVLMTVSFAAALVIARYRRDVSMAPPTCLSQVLVLAVAVPFADLADAGGRDIVLLAGLGAGQIGLGLALLTVGARLIPPAEVALISLLEVVLGPLWVWIAYAERPSTATLAGGAVVLSAVLLQVGADLRAGGAGALRRLARRRPGPVPPP
jgi:drug/metabolite transporter (DMT)-like permease